MLAHLRAKFRPAVAKTAGGDAGQTNKQTNKLFSLYTVVYRLGYSRIRISAHHPSRPKWALIRNGHLTGLVILLHTESQKWAKMSQKHKYFIINYSETISYKKQLPIAIQTALKIV